MSYCNEYLAGLNESLKEEAQKGRLYTADVSARARLRVISFEPFVRGKNYCVYYDAPRLGNCAIVGFTNEVTSNGGENPTGIAWANPEAGLERAVYLGFKATPDHLHGAAEFTGFPPGFVIPLPEEFVASERLELGTDRQFAEVA